MYVQSTIYSNKLIDISISYSSSCIDMSKIIYSYLIQSFCSFFSCCMCWVNIVISTYCNSIKLDFLRTGHYSRFNIGRRFNVCSFNITTFKINAQFILILMFLTRSCSYIWDSSKCINCIIIYAIIYITYLTINLGFIINLSLLIIPTKVCLSSYFTKLLPLSSIICTCNIASIYIFSILIIVTCRISSLNQLKINTALYTCCWESLVCTKNFIYGSIKMTKILQRYHIVPIKRSYSISNSFFCLCYIILKIISNIAFLSIICQIDISYSVRKNTCIVYMYILNWNRYITTIRKFGPTCSTLTISPVYQFIITISLRYMPNLTNCICTIGYSITV